MVQAIRHKTARTGINPKDMKIPIIRSHKEDVAPFIYKGEYRIIATTCNGYDCVLTEGTKIYFTFCGYSENEFNDSNSYLLVIINDTTGVDRAFHICNIFRHSSPLSFDAKVRLKEIEDIIIRGAKSRYDEDVENIVIIASNLPKRNIKLVRMQINGVLDVCVWEYMKDDIYKSEYNIMTSDNLAWYIYHNGYRIALPSDHVNSYNFHKLKCPYR